MKKVVILFLIFILSAAAIYSQSKYALVIGNSSYGKLGTLKNPVNDASDIAGSLEKTGFKVDLQKNKSLMVMEKALVNFKNRLSLDKGSVGFFYFAGHGIQSGGENYLIPAGADIEDEAFLKNKSMPLQSVLDNLSSAGNSLNIIVLDACRDNPFSWKRSSKRGLSVVGYQPPGSIIVYSTSAGKAASDGRGRNGLFTSELLKHLETPGIDVSEVFRRTGKGVSEATKGSQIPAVYNQFFNRFSLNSSSEKKSEYSSVSDIDADTEMVFVKGGVFMMGSGRGNADEKPAHSVSLSDFYIGKYEVSQDEYISVTGRNPSAFSGEGLPVEKVSWYDAVEYCNALSRKEGYNPVYIIDKSLKDPVNRSDLDKIKWTVEYDRTADGYRLPTEAEWEYAARGGSLSRGFAYSGSDRADDAGWHDANSADKAHESGTKAANELGIYDMSGNLMEWCWDWYDSKYYSASPSKSPAGPFSGENRVLRGGSWNYSASNIMSLNRLYANANGKSNFTGFRVVRSAD